ncbi:hypothetical protein K7X08_031209 [Anisodus acutangulus]|uniref:Uncharacterized protein n=1 Tax=Anisodus acutangulus TaxID=402998 RepID=A0A9Q1RLH5_9SOLA|nr:hypothetical protein K7X08_031209 [Anisodus acutangulus]
MRPLNNKQLIGGKETPESSGEQSSEEEDRTMTGDMGGNQSLEKVGGKESVVRDCGVERDGVAQIQTVSPLIDFNINRSLCGIGEGDSYANDLGREVDTPRVTKTTGVSISKLSCCCECEKCFHKFDVLFGEIKSLSSKLEEQQPKRNIFPSYTRRSLYTPELRRRLVMNTKTKNARTKNKLKVNLYKPLAVVIEVFKAFISKKVEERKMYLSD